MAFAAPALPYAHSAPAVPITDAWDMSWTDRIRGKFRAVFDSPELSDGDALFRACAWCDQQREVYGTPRSEMSPVVVFRHKAIPLVMNDTYWARFKVGKAEKVKNDATKEWFTTNPIWATPPGMPERFKEYNLERFLASGGIVLACHLAFGEIVSKIKEKDKLSNEDAERVARQQLVPGVILQPSGVFAALRAQQEGCGYIVGS